jgi:hypothetical protein
MPQRLSDVSLSQLVPETREWNDGRGIDLLSWIGCVGNIEQAIAYGELFWPEFVEFDGCIFFAGFSEESFQGFMSQTGGQRRAVETVMNHQHIVDLFSGSGQQLTRPQVVYFGRLLREMWSAKLQRDFPGRQIIVSFPEDDIEGLGDYEITVYQERD